MAYFAATGGAMAAAAADRRRQMMLAEEEEGMTGYTQDDLGNDWEFKIVRSDTAAFRKPEVLKKLVEEEASSATYTPRWTGREGTLEFPGGHVFNWAQTDFWATKYQITDGAGNTLVSFESGAEKARLSDMFKTQARVEISLGGRSIPELPLLVLLGWYLVILQKQDAATVAATTVAAMG